MQFYTKSLNMTQINTIARLKGTVFSIKHSNLFLVFLPIKSNVLHKKNRLILIKGEIYE